MKKSKSNQKSMIVLIILLVVFTRLYITRDFGLAGSSYIFSALDFIMIFIIYLPFALKSIVSKLINAKIRTMQGSNARRVIYGAFLIAIFYSIVVSVILLVFGSNICKLLLLGKQSETVILYLIPSIFFVAFGSVIKGYFAGIKAHSVDMLAEFVEKVSVIVSTVLLCNIFNFKGQKVANVLYNKEYEYAYSALGAALGITIGLFISLIFSYFLFRLNQDKLYDNGSDKKTDDIYDVFSWISSDVIKNSGFLTVFFIFVTISQTYFFKTTAKEPLFVTRTYIYGSFCGPLFDVLIFAVLYFYLDSKIHSKSIKIAMKNTNVSELRIKGNDLVSACLVFTIPLTIFAEISAGQIASILCKGENQLVTNVLRAGSPLIIFISLAIVTSNIINGLSKQTRLLINSLTALAFGFLSLILFTSTIKIGIYGIIISFYIYSTVLIVMNILLIMNVLKYKLSINERVLPALIISVITGFVVFLLILLFGLCMNDVAIFAATFILFILSTFIAMVKVGIVNSYTLSNALIGKIFSNIGRAIHIL